MTSDLAGKTARGVAWMTSARAAVRVLGMLSTLFLARLLTPADFGLVAMAMVLASGLELLTQFNFDMALVQNRSPTRDHYDSAWSLNLLMGLALATLLAIGAGPAAHFYNEPRLEAVILLLALKYLVDSAGNPGIADFRRNLQFRPEFYLQVAPKVAGVLTTVPLAWWLGDYRALLAGMLITSTVGCILSYVVHPHRPRWCVAKAGSLFRFSRWLLLNNLMSFLRTRSADLIIGRTLGPVGLGIFSIASELANLPSTEMIQPINRVLFPSYVRLATEPERLREGFRTTLGFIALLVLPVCIGVAALAEPMVRVLLGDKWLDTIPLIPLLATAGASLVLQTTTGSVYNALGKPKMIALTGAIHAAILIPLLLMATPAYGLMGAATAVLFYSVVPGIFATYVIFLRTTSVKLWDIVQVCWRPILACATMFLTLRSLLSMFDPSEAFLANLLKLSVGCVVGAAVYLSTIVGLWLVTGRPPGAETSLWAMTRSRLGAKF